MTSDARVLTEDELSALPAGPLFQDQTWDLSYHHALGETAGRFLGGLKAKRLLGRRCDECSRVLLPARSFCDRCHCPTGDWVEVSTHGRLEMFTIIYEPFKGMRPPPYVLAYTLLDGADTALLGYLEGLALDDTQAALQKLKIGAPIQVRFRDEPVGNVTDYWFELDES